jgi:hypothetical protein
VNTREKLIQNKQWITSRELTPFILSILWLTRQRKTPLEKEFYFHLEKINKLLANNKWTFTHFYLKGVSHVTIRYFAGTPLEGTYFGKTLVKVDSKTGLPMFFRKSFRDEILKWNRSRDLLKIIALLSFIGVYRSFRTDVVADLSTITDPHSGDTETLSIEKISAALKDMGIQNLNSHRLKARLVNSDKAGPNSHNALWGAEIDAFAILRTPVFIP